MSRYGGGNHSAMTRKFESEWAPFRTGTSYFTPCRAAGTTPNLLELVIFSGAIRVLPSAVCPMTSRTIVFAYHG